MDASEHRAAHRDTIRHQIREGARLDFAYVFMNVLAATVACYGLLADSAAVVIGAMVIAMLLGPIIGIGLALVDGDAALLRKGSVTVICGVLVVLVTAFVVGLLHRMIPAGKELLSRTSPNLFDLMIALGGGAAGAYAMISPRLSTAFVGVAIATALVPPLATASIFLARGQAPLAVGAFLLAVTNMVAIQVAASVVLWCHGYQDVLRRRNRTPSVLAGDAVSVAVLLALAVVLGLNLHHLTRQLLFEATTRARLAQALGAVPGSYLAEVRISREPAATIVRAVVRGPQAVTADQVGAMETQLPPPLDGTRLELRIRYVYATVLTRKGPLYTDETDAAATSYGPSQSPIAEK